MFKAFTMQTVFEERKQRGLIVRQMLMSKDALAMNQKFKTAKKGAISQSPPSFKPQNNGSEQVNGAEKEQWHRAKGVQWQRSQTKPRHIHDSRF